MTFSPKCQFQIFIVFAVLHESFSDSSRPVHEAHQQAYRQGKTFSIVHPRSLLVGFLIVPRFVIKPSQQSISLRLERKTLEKTTDIEEKRTDRKRQEERDKVRSSRMLNLVFMPSLCHRFAKIS
ncbi:hypothetical protein IRJ41_009686 [Triplophysa rosa]|uniref:Uncharacterized protein n=1 Tax=Triplophysa rosa TaxID=992332 RepID=A0A9W7T6D7_TRIRA|nr:hypothetical protein IRJ41_009686 [Triplophysa rosa]